MECRVEGAQIQATDIVNYEGHHIVISLAITYNYSQYDNEVCEEF
jgi:hypothetical protein